MSYDFGASKQAVLDAWQHFTANATGQSTDRTLIADFMTEVDHAWQRAEDEAFVNALKGTTRPVRYTDEFYMTHRARAQPEASGSPSPFSNTMAASSSTSAETEQPSAMAASSSSMAETHQPTTRPFRAMAAFNGETEQPEASGSPSPFWTAVEELLAAAETEQPSTMAANFSSTAETLQPTTRPLRYTDEFYMMHWAAAPKKLPKRARTAAGELF